MLGKFIVWLLVKRIFALPIKMCKLMYEFFMGWKEYCRYDWQMAAYAYLLMTCGCIMSNLIGVLIAIPESEITRDRLAEAVMHGFGFAICIFVVVMLLAAYDTFKEEYEKSFTILKE